MSVYTNIISQIEGVFGTSEWAATGIDIIPSNFRPHDDPQPEYLVLEVLPASGLMQEYGNRVQIGGLIIVQIYIAVNEGTRRLFEISDTLDTFLNKQAFNFNLQTAESSLEVKGSDPDNGALFRGDYVVKFNSY